MSKISNLLFSVVGCIFFFLNTLGLQSPLSYTSIISTLYFKSLLNRKNIIIVSILLLVSILYMFVHFIFGVEKGYYIKSSVFTLALVISSIISYHYIAKNTNKMESLFCLSSVIAFAFFLFSLFFYSTEYDYLFWKYHDFIGEGEITKRYKGFSYEPSHYALTLAPVFIYHLIRLMYKVSWKSIIYIIMVGLPIAFTLSFGFFVAIFLALVSAILIVLFSSKQIKKVFLLFLLSFFIGFVVVESSENIVSKRIDKIIKGKDTSVNGRTYEAFYLAYECAKVKSTWFGVGPGQIKIVGEKIIRPFYLAKDKVGYSKENWPTMAIPNSLAETLATYGIIGLVTRLAIQLTLFFRLKVYKNFFSLFLFSYLFIYQFMGSFILSSNEIIIWIIAILPIFKEFDITPSKKFKFI